MQLPPECHLYNCAQQQGAAFINEVWEGTRELWCWILQKGRLHGSSGFYIDIAGTYQSVWPNSSDYCHLSETRCRHIAPVLTLAPLCDHPPQPLRHTFALVTLSELKKSVWQAFHICVSYSAGGCQWWRYQCKWSACNPITSVKQLYGFLELGCCSKWSDQVSLFLVTQNQNLS